MDSSSKCNSIDSLYQPVSLSDSHEILTAWRHLDVERLPRKKVRNNPFLIIVTVSLFICVGILGLLLFRRNVKGQPLLLGESHGLVPDFSVRPVLFLADPSATSDHSTQLSLNATAENWLSYVPRGNGFVVINNSKEHYIPSPIKMKGKEVYSLAVFHQLHCLYTIMSVYDHMVVGSSLGMDDSESKKENHNHVDHCFRYLRQSILCAGDTALEGQNPNAIHAGTDGTGAVHMCKDYDEILRWAEMNRIVDGKHL